MTVFRLFKQVWSRPPVPTADFTGKTVLVTGANVGLGKEAVKHFVGRGATKVIATIRSSTKGEAALAEIEAYTVRPGIVEMWELDYSRYASVKDFGNRVAELSRVDAVILNAGVATKTFERFEDNESSITVNVMTLSDPKTTSMNERYAVLKLLQLLAMREIAERTAKLTPFVVVNSVSPGLCVIGLTRSAEGVEALVIKAMQALVAWTAEEGSRTLFHATVAGPESHGVLLDECRINNDALAPWIATEEGKQVQKKVWRELAAKLETIQPGIMKSL